MKTTRTQILLAAALSDALMAEAKVKNWIVISMKDDWKKVFAFEK